VTTATAYKSFRFRAKTTWSSARRATLSAAGKPNVVVGSPPEFKGEPDNWAPEELLVGSVNTCIMLTFLTLAGARGLNAAGYDSEAEGLLEASEGTYRMTEITVRPRITVHSEAEVGPIREVIDRTEPHCFMSNSVRAKVTVIAEVSIASARN
jgi:organic hydroperoxide reductase OsmC/OhrA